MKVASVIIDSRTRQVDKGFTYRVPEPLLASVQVGVRVRVPFGGGNRHEIGYVIKTESLAEHAEVKSIVEVLDEAPLFTREKLVEAYWIKNRYFSTFAEAIKLFLPPGSAAKLTEWVHLADTEIPLDNMEKKVADILTENGGICAFDVLKAALGERTRAVINGLAEKKGITLSHTTHKAVGVRRMRILRFVNRPTGKLSEAASRAVRIMQECACLSMTDLCLFASCSASTVHTLLRKGILEAEEVEVLRTPSAKATPHEKSVLNEEQAAVAAAIRKHPRLPFQPILLHGVTGSGKTEVYLDVIEDVLQHGKSAIVLVPEIALTHQMVGRFLSRFGSQTAVLHSRLSLGERHDEWLRIARGQARVVIGARSAVFAPCQNLGLMIVDEEHEDTYKSETGVRYHAREVAMCRSKTEGAKVLFASATPSVESYYRAMTGVYAFLQLRHRYKDAQLPTAYIADMRREMERGNASPISAQLRQALEQNIQNGEQSILFLNRRGHSTAVSCRACGHVETCPHCSISLTYHSFSDTLNCHYCGYRKKNTRICPACQSPHLSGHGTGTQKIEDMVEEAFPRATIVRMDVDTTRKKEAHEKMLGRFREENLNILLGTQMIAKGLDFPNVTLVGVLNADQMLQMEDYRSNERTFSLITQVLGRAGRGEKPGRAIIQTYSPENPVILAAAKQAYEAFFEEEIIIRKALNYPPFCDIINIIISGRAEEEARRGCEVLFRRLEKAVGKDVQLFRAAPCGIHKIKNTYRWHTWMKCRLTKDLGEKIRTVISAEKKLSVQVDVNPVSM